MKSSQQTSNMATNTMEQETTATFPPYYSNRRRRRHFAYEFKKKVLRDIQAGKLHIENVRDLNGIPIKPLIIERWKDQLRGTAGTAATIGALQPSQPHNITPLAMTERDALVQLVSKLTDEIALLKYKNLQLVASKGEGKN